MDSLAKISPKFTEDTLKEVVGGTEVLDYKLDLCNNRGCSYLSEVSRLQITGQHRGCDDDSFIVHVLVKALAKSRARRLTFRSPIFFEREINFFTRVCPAFDAFQQRYRIPKPFDDVPK